MAIDADRFSTWFDNIATVTKLQNASNLVFEIVLSNGIEYIFKPAAGERPLWDFQAGTLWKREYLAYQFMKMLEIEVPAIEKIQDSPYGPGNLIQKIEIEDFDFIEIVDEKAQLDASWLLSFYALDESGNTVGVWHRNSFALRRVCLADLVINNADRKVSHLIRSQGTTFAIDHGLSFHENDKLRTFIWGWAGESFTADEVTLLEGLIQNLTVDSVKQTLKLSEIDALKYRIKGLIAKGSFPHPPQDRYFLPSPIY